MEAGIGVITPVSDEEVVDVVVSVRIPGLQGEDGRVGRCVELDDGLHRQRPVDEVRRFIVDVFHLDNDALVVRICCWTEMKYKEQRKKEINQSVSNSSVCLS